MLTFYDPLEPYDTTGSHIIYLVHLYGKETPGCVSKEGKRLKPKGKTNR